MKSTIFYNTLKSNRVDIRFNAIANAFPNCNIVRGYEGVQDCDIAIIQGWSKKKGKGAHNLLRKLVIETQLEKNKNILTIDGNIFNYLSKGIYFRYSLNGIYANTGYYFDNTIDPNRWKKIKSTIGFDLKSWRQEGEHILILLQKDSGWTMEEKSNISWCSETINKIRKYTDRPIVIRMHPSDVKHKENYLMMARNKKVTLSENKNIMQDLPDITKLQEKQGDYTTLDNISKHMINAIVSLEDRRYRNHGGRIHTCRCRPHHRNRCRPHSQPRS